MKFTCRNWFILLLALWGCVPGENNHFIMTVNGPVSTAEMGTTLIHEHVLVDFIGADSTGYRRWDRQEAARIILPYLREAQKKGLQTFFDCTPAFIGRDPRLLKMLADSTGLNIVTNTGLYGAVDNKFLPLYAFDATAEDLAARWIREFEKGIEGTGIKPGFIKIGVNPGRLSPQHRKLITAAAITHKATGLTIASHTGPAEPAFQQLEILEKEGVPASAFIWVHAQNEPDPARHVEAAQRGAWISLDGLTEDNQQDYLALIQNLKENNLLDHLLLSHDAGWYSPGELNGGEFRGYTTLLTSFRERLLANGFSDDEFVKIVQENPARAFSLMKSAE
ncbi:phosphotriesterase family protein [Fulvivirga sedimenti]|uniref:Phosphotriesterase n=1 Tax=Fulvivirga sedimenti TaxID=2879465 RepID=A0A9X1HPT8_9BACT|nr:phosphotriesterase [Fulvivirga sedimenti]MCA6075626.1 phosphotriesterase [Fulvivirga sedimenti]